MHAENRVSGSDSPSTEQLQAENEALRAELDRLKNEAVERWAEIVRTRGVGMTEYENTLSWRVTRPLRVGRKVQLAAREMGLANALRYAGSRLTVRLRKS